MARRHRNKKSNSYLKHLIKLTKFSPPLFQKNRFNATLLFFRSDNELFTYTCIHIAMIYVCSATPISSSNCYA